MRHVKGIEHRAGAQDQRCIGIDQSRRFYRRGSQGVVKAIRTVPESGLPVPAGSKESRQGGSGSGCEDGFYRETVRGIDKRGQKGSSSEGGKHKRICIPGTGSFCPQGSGGWPQEREKLNRSNLNTALTDWQPRRSSRFINSWFPIRPG